jgi:hypothetical protein
VIQSMHVNYSSTHDPHNNNSRSTISERSSDTRTRNNIFSICVCLPANRERHQVRQASPNSKRF